MLPRTRHVGLIERHPLKAYATTCWAFATWRLAALRCGAALFVNISSDKA
jgi:FlaA1/EpsC-like NDP-sugar epimerase